jgi:hypothetical protein
VTARGRHPPVTRQVVVQLIEVDDPGRNRMQA